MLITILDLAWGSDAGSEIFACIRQVESAEEADVMYSVSSIDVIFTFGQVMSDCKVRYSIIDRAVVHGRLRPRCATNDVYLLIFIVRQNLVGIV